MTPREELDAKIANERLKLFASLLNGLASAAVVGSLVAPLVGKAILDPFWSLLVACVGGLLHLIGHLVLDFLRPERRAMATVWVVPFALATIGAALYVAAWSVSRRFDRRHPHLSREGRLEAERRIRPSPEADKRQGVPVPPFQPDDWRMQSARDDLESERLDRSLARWSEQRARSPAPTAEPDGAPRR